MCLGILTCFERAPSSHPHDHPHHSTYMFFCWSLLSLMGTCHYWTDDVLFSGLYRWNAPKHTANNANSFLQTQREEWIGHVLGGDLLGREFSRRVCILNLCPCVADSCQLGWSVYPECQGEFCPGKQRLTLNCLFLLSTPDRLFTECLACFPALSEWLCKLEFTIALASQGRHPQPCCPVWHTAVDLGSASVACLSPRWPPSPAQPFLRVGPPLLYQTCGVCTRGRLEVTGGETARPSLQLFYCFTCASVVACVSSEVMCMGLFFNPTQFCFLIMIFFSFTVEIHQDAFLCLGRCRCAETWLFP